MSVVDKLETVAEGWLKPVPHLPINARKWLAENVWWLSIVSVIASIIGFFIIVSTILTYMSVIGAVAGFYSTQVYGTGWIFSTLLSLGFSVAVTVLTAFAVVPLRAAKKKGWDLLFMALIVGALSAVVGALVRLDLGALIGGIIVGAILVAIGAYFLFEIRSYFVKGNSRVKVSNFQTSIKSK